MAPRRMRKLLWVLQRLSMRPLVTLVALLDALGGRVGKLDFQKLLFLYCNELSPVPYEFVPYKFGAFSFTSYADRRKLVERGLFADEENWVLTTAGRRALGSKVDADVTAFARATKSLRGNARRLSLTFFLIFCDC